MLMSLRMLRRYHDSWHVDENGCWIWDKTMADHGYGAFYANGKTYKAHRFVWQMQRGPVPGGMELDHICRVRACVNPAHLEVVSHDENMRRGIHNMKRYCVNGHPLFGENVRVYADESGRTRRRNCRECQRINGRKYKAKKRQERNAVHE